MTKVRSIFGLIGGIILLLSSGAHSILEWKGLSEKLAETNVPADLVFGLKAGWEFGGVAMLAFGIIVVAAFVNRLRGRYVSTFPSMIIAVALLGIGAWALIASNFAPFFWLFIVIGLLLLVGAWPSSDSFPGGRSDSETSDYIH
jgi:hypothetical protein